MHRPERSLRTNTHSPLPLLPGLSDQNNMQDGAPRETLLRNSHLIVGVGCPRERFCAALTSPNIAQQLNEDGFGVGWYHKRGGAIFRSVTAAWNNSNLRELSESIESRCIFAHVRAASGSVISEVNCHPFRYGVQAWRCRADAAVNRVSSPLLLSQAVCSSSTTDTSRALTASSGECSLRCAMTSATCCKRLGFWRLSVHLA